MTGLLIDGWSAHYRNASVPLGSSTPHQPLTLASEPLAKIDFHP